MTFFTYLQVVISDNFNESITQSRDLHARNDLRNQLERINMRACILQKSGHKHRIFDALANQIVPQLLVVLFFYEINGL